MATGAFLLRFIRHKLSKLPVIGVVAKPLLGERESVLGRLRQRIVALLQRLQRCPWASMQSSLLTAHSPIHTIRGNPPTPKPHMNSKPPTPTNATALVPVTMLGAAAGAAVVFTVEEGGDLSAVRRKLLPKARRHAARAGAEMMTVVQEVKREADKTVKEHERVIRRLQEEGKRLAPSLEQAAAEAERVLLPVVERGRREVERSLRELEAGGARAAEGRGRRWDHGDSDRSLVRRFIGGSESE